MTDAAPRRRFEFRQFTLSKDADAPEQNQDAAAVNAAALAAAIADGVSAGIFCGRWARLLVDALVASPPDVDDRDAWRAWLAAQRAAWRAQIDVSRLAWFQKAKLRDGAFTTLVWLRIEEPPRDGVANSEPAHAPDNAGDARDAHSERPVEPAARVRAWAVGDSCLLHVRGGAIVGRFPIERTDDFGAAPLGLGSIDLNRDELVVFARYDAPAADGDLLVLCTDALAEYFLRCDESGASIDWESYWSLSEAEWLARIEALRNARELRYDDTTLLLVRLVAGDPPGQEKETGPAEPKLKADPVAARDT